MKNDKFEQFDPELEEVSRLLALHAAQAKPSETQLKKILARLADETEGAPEQRQYWLTKYLISVGVVFVLLLVIVLRGKVSPSQHPVSEGSVVSSNESNDISTEEQALQNAASELDRYFQEEQSMQATDASLTNL